MRENIMYTLITESVHGISARDKITELLSVLSLTEPRRCAVASIDRA